jgi:carbon-monoxide dehydrogenase medium subunit
MTTIAEDEILTAIELPVAPPGAGDACVEVARRAGDYAMCGGVARITVADGAFVDVRLALFGLAGVPARVPNVEEALRGGEASPEAIASATPAATEEIELSGDDRVPEDYRRHLACVVARRTLGAALERSG